MNEIKNIELVLENCEVITIPKESLGTFQIENIQRSIRRVAMNSVSSMLHSDKIVIQIHSLANQDDYFASFSKNPIKPFERLTQYNDVTAVYVHYENGETEGIYVDWNEDSEYENTYQSSAINERTGDLYLVVSAKENVHTYFEEELPDADDSFWTLYR